MSEVVVLSPEQLEAIVRRAVEMALAEREDTAVPALLDRNSLAKALGCSIASIDRLRRDGMPCVQIFDAPRFVLADVLTWLRERGA